MAIIDRVKLRLNDIEGVDELLAEIIDTVESRMRVLYFDGGCIPEDLEYVIVELSIVRYNRISSEGMDSQTVEGESMTFSQNDFRAYESDIFAYLRSVGGQRGRLRFL